MLIYASRAHVTYQLLKIVVFRHRFRESGRFPEPLYRHTTEMEKTKYTSGAGRGKKNLTGPKRPLRAREDPALPVSSHRTLIPSEDSREDSAQTPLPKMASRSQLWRWQGEYTESKGHEGLSLFGAPEGVWCLSQSGYLSRETPPPTPRLRGKRLRTRSLFANI